MKGHTVNDLTRPTPANGTGDVTPWSLSRSEARSLERARNAQAAEGAVRATRVQAAGVVAATGLHMSAMLSREAQFQADGDPAAAARLNFIVDSFAEYAANEVRRFNL